MVMIVANILKNVATFNCDVRSKFVKTSSLPVKLVEVSYCKAHTAQETGQAVSKVLYRPVKLKVVV